MPSAKRDGAGDRRRRRHRGAGACGRAARHGAADGRWRPVGRCRILRPYGGRGRMPGMPGRPAAGPAGTHGLRRAADADHPASRGVCCPDAATGRIRAAGRPAPAEVAGGRRQRDRSAAARPRAAAAPARRCARAAAAARSAAPGRVLRRAAGCSAARSVPVLRGGAEAPAPARRQPERRSAPAPGAGFRRAATGGRGFDVRPRAPARGGSGALRPARARGASGCTSTAGARLHRRRLGHLVVHGLVTSDVVAVGRSPRDALGAGFDRLGLLDQARRPSVGASRLGAARAPRCRSWRRRLRRRLALDGLGRRLGEDVALRQRRCCAAWPGARRTAGPRSLRACSTRSSARCRGSS